MIDIPITHVPLPRPALTKEVILRAAAAIETLAECRAECRAESQRLNDGWNLRGAVMEIEISRTDKAAGGECHVVDDLDAMEAIHKALREMYLRRGLAASEELTALGVKP